MVGVVLLLALTSRSCLEPYNSVGGQLVVGIAAALWVTGFVGMSCLGRVAPVQRFLIKRDGFRVSEGSAAVNPRVGGR